MSWADSYFGQLRAAAGDRTLLFVGARGVVRDETGGVLLIHRVDDGFWAIPGGAMELGESIADCAIREVWEETGIRAAEALPYAVYTGPTYTGTNVWGHTYQYFVVAFVLTAWSGDLVPDPAEATEVGFYAPEALPAPLHRSVPESLADLAVFEATGRLVVK